MKSHSSIPNVFQNVARCMDGLGLPALAGGDGDGLFLRGLVRFVKSQLKLVARLYFGEVLGAPVGHSNVLVHRARVDPERA